MANYGDITFASMASTTTSSTYPYFDGGVTYGQYMGISRQEPIVIEPPKVVWTLEDGLQLIREIWEEVRQFQYHLCLGGGVLNKGESTKDLDLYFLPMGEDEDADGLVQWLAQRWGPGQDINDPAYIPEGNDPYTYRLKFTVNNARVDVFIL